MATPVREALAKAERAAWHLEMRDGYMLDDPAFIRWQNGHREDPDDRASWWRPWLDVVVEATARGVEMRRLRVVSEPVSDYIRYEYDITFTNVAAGESVRWLPRARARDLLLPALDGWVFDGESLILHHFSGDGQWTGPGMEVVHDPDLASRYGAVYEAAWDRAIPHAEYAPA
ncbi:DUF6879 family protein [Streptomyces radicis]|uniref:DUF6879 domain-containing protein n=1 Tax=Streptomyces radicis TaxID=1750517 RepID=A0A3A9WY09_9ACTN|nr:DUF6879 family protein [Streptomyces radicis]RKN11067.1 hypothetical protein D7319_08125 [Streptomyces radicis]RKN25330.1 hypothetical protein D7318_08980 [Streptomyces radicis]